MTSRLAIFRARLHGLRRARAAYRAIAAWSALGSSLIISSLGVFLLDFLFGLAVVERIIVILLAVLAVAWAFWKFTRPLIGCGESEIEMALLVEQQHAIDTDLVAALQFELPASATWGSPGLQGAVVDYVAAASKSIDVFRGFDHRRTARRAGLLLACVAFVFAVAVYAPGYLAAFANRLLLGSMHYPTRTRIDQICVNDAVVYERVATGAAAEAASADCKAAQGRPLSFLIQCSGRLPATGRVAVSANDSGGGRTQLELRPLSSAERLARLREAAAQLNDALQSDATDVSPSLKADIRLLVSFDAPQAVGSLMSARSRKELETPAAKIAAAIDHWPGNASSIAVLAAELPRLNDDVTFKVSAGDAWTEPSHVQMIPLPVVEAKITARPPKYAANRMQGTTLPGGQLAVLEGSSIDLSVESMNRKSLSAAWVIVQAAGGTQRVELKPRDPQRFTWSPGEGNSPLHDIHHELQYEIQVTDVDGLSLETPIRGTIRIRTDELPTVVADVLHKVVLPTAEPVVRHRSSDDFGISKIALLVAVERIASQPVASSHASNPPNEADNIAPAMAAPSELHRFELLPTNEPQVGDQLPAAGSYALSLSPLKLTKGDSLKLTLEVTDYRGENDQGQPTGQATLSDSLVLQISDESGVLAAISEGDQRSEQQLSEIIKRQLGVGDQPQ